MIICLSVLVLSGCDKKHNIFFKPGNPNAGLPASILKDTTSVQFAETEYKFGSITEGEKVEHFFTFKNTGQKALIIANAWGSCGCTVPDYPREPIAPGAEGKVKVTFNSTGKRGEQHKSVTMQMNTLKHNEEIYLVGNVNPLDSTSKK